MRRGLAESAAPSASSSGRCGASRTDVVRFNARARVRITCFYASSFCLRLRQSTATIRDVSRLCAVSGPTLRFYYVRGEGSELERYVLDVPGHARRQVVNARTVHAPSYMFLTMRCYMTPGAIATVGNRKYETANTPNRVRVARLVRYADRTGPRAIGYPGPWVVRRRAVDIAYAYRARVPVNIARDIIRPVARNRPVTAFAAVRVANGGDSDAAPGRRVLLCPASGPR